MRLFAISDLHLPGGQDKPMDRFGDHWQGHFDKIKADWCAKVGPDDLVLVPGDHSWAMAFPDALKDLGGICALPGSKVLIKGNHDFWWSSITRVRAALPPGAYALQYDAVRIGDVAVAGTRGWDFQDPQGGVLVREQMRLEMSLKKAQAMEAPRMVAMTHYPPFDEKGRETPFTGLMEQYGVTDVVYGHMHGQAVRAAVTGTVNGVNYHLVSCDALDFKLKEIE